MCKKCMFTAVHAWSLEPDAGAAARREAIPGELAHFLERHLAQEELITHRPPAHHLLAARCIETFHTPYER